MQCGSGGRGRPLRRRPQIEVAVGDAWRRNAADGRDDEGDRDSEPERIDWRQRRCRQAGEEAGRVEPIGRSVTLVMVRADRKSVVEGKGVAVGVDFGGRRIMKKK